MIDEYEKHLQQPKTKTKRTINALHWMGHGISLVILIVLLFRDPLSSHILPTPDSPARPTIYTRASEALGDQSHSTVFQNSFWQESPYKGPPTSEVIAKWHHLTRPGPLNITAEEMTRLGQSLDAVQYFPGFRGGYLAYLESAHQLHCLEALWENHHYANHAHLFPDLTEKLRMPPDIMKSHYEHCVDVIRNQLMCTADSQLVTFRWVEGVHGPYPYFNTKHQCEEAETCAVNLGSIVVQWKHCPWLFKYAIFPSSSAFLSLIRCRSLSRVKH